MPVESLHSFHGTARRACAAAVLLACAALAGAPAQAAGLAELIREAAANDPNVLEAQARAEQAEMQTEVSRSGHWPMLGVTSTSRVAGDKYATTEFTGLTGKINVFSAGAVSKRVERDESREKYYGEKVQESRENVAGTIAQQYLLALRSREFMQTEQRNLKRHEKIIDDLKIIVKHDQGREYELVQAQSRALQVRMRIVQYEKATKLALSKLTRYTRQPVTLQEPFGADWRKAVPDDAKAHNPSIQAQMHDMEATRAEMESLRRARWPAIDLVFNKGTTRGIGPTQSVNVAVNWNFLDRGAYYSQKAAGKQITAAERRVESMQRELDEKTQTAEADMAQSALQAEAARQQIGASERVVELYEMQFRIARRSLLELLNAYAELASVEVSKVAAENDYRNAVASYLEANAVLAAWARQQSPASRMALATDAQSMAPRVPAMPPAQPEPAAAEVAQSATSVAASQSESLSPAPAAAQVETGAAPFSAQPMQDASTFSAIPDETPPASAATAIDAAAVSDAPINEVAPAGTDAKAYQDAVLPTENADPAREAPEAVPVIQPTRPVSIAPVQRPKAAATTPAAPLSFAVSRDLPPMFDD